MRPAVGRWRVNERALRVLRVSRLLASRVLVWVVMASLRGVVLVGFCVGCRLLGRVALGTRALEARALCLQHGEVAHFVELAQLALAVALDREAPRPRDRLLLRVDEQEAVSRDE